MPSVIKVVQVIPQDNYKVIVYFVDGAVKKYDVSHLVGEGVFECLKDIEFYKNNCWSMVLTLYEKIL